MTYLEAAKLSESASINAKRAVAVQDPNASALAQAVDYLAQAVAELARSMHRET